MRSIILLLLLVSSVQAQTYTPLPPAATTTGTIEAVTEIWTTALRSGNGTACATIADSSGKMDVTTALRAASLGVGEAASNTTGVATVLTEIRVPAIKAHDGTTALTFTDSTGVVAFSATPTGTDLDFSGTLYGHTVQADHLTDEAGTGAPSSNHSTGTNCEYWGMSAGAGTIGPFNTALGYRAAWQSSGGSNTAVGIESLYQSPGSNNVAIGNAALYQSAGSNNAAGGDSALLSSPGSYNTAFGASSGAASAGSNNVALGTSAGRSSAGDENVAIGYDAHRTSTGSNNVAMGSNALGTAAGSLNVALGVNALYQSAGSSNTAVGLRALQQSPGDQNVAVGTDALRRSLGTNNVALGFHETAPGADRSVNRITAIGALALEDIVTGADNLVALGYAAGHTATTTTNQFYLGGWNGTTQYPLTLNWETTAVNAGQAVRAFVNRTEYQIPLVSAAGTLIVTGEVRSDNYKDGTGHGGMALDSAGNATFHNNVSVTGKVTTTSFTLTPSTTPTPPDTGCEFWSDINDNSSVKAIFADGVIVTFITHGAP